MTDDLAALVAETAAPDFMNPIHALAHARARDTPAKRWWYAQVLHPAIFRALRLDPKESGAVYAAMPFRLSRDGEGNACILVALPCPRLFDADDDWLGIEVVLAWYPQTGKVIDLEDAEPNHLVGELPADLAEPTHVFADPFAFFRAMAEARAQWLTSFYANADPLWRRRPHEPRHVPGFLVIGNPEKVRWPTLTAEIHCHGIDPRKVNHAILRQSTLPRAIAAHNLRIAA
jgi:hypothetical protein